MKDTTTTSVLSVRLNPDERAILEAAAEADVLGRMIVAIPAKDWGQFEAWIGAPAKAIPALEELGGATPSWEK